MDIKLELAQMIRRHRVCDALATIIVDPVLLFSSKSIDTRLLVRGVEEAARIKWIAVCNILLRSIGCCCRNSALSHGLESK